MQHSFLFTRALRRAGAVSASVGGSLTLALALSGLASGFAAATPAPHLVKPAVHPDTAGASGYLAGYQAAPSGGLASASATFTVPKSKCTTSDKTHNAQYWAGVYTDSVSTYAFVNSTCTPGGTLYSFVFATPAGSFIESGDANAGDVVVTSLFQAAGETEAEIHDLTNGEYWVAADPVNVGDTVVDIGTYSEAGEGLLVPKFTAFTLSNATVNGDYLGFEAPSEINAVNGGDLLIKTSALKTSGTGSSFTQTFEKAQ